MADNVKSKYYDVASIDATKLYNVMIDKYKSYKCEIYFKDGNEPRKLTITAKSKQMATIMLWRFLYLKNKINDVSHVKITNLRASKSNMQYFERTHTDEFMKEQLDVLKMEYADNDETILKIREDADR